MSRSPFRPARSASIAINALKTVLQVAVLWGLFLVVIPWFIVLGHAWFGIPRFEPGWGQVAAFAIFWAAGFTGFYCGWLFVRHGRGTPLPLDTTTQFVVAGPYRWVRNPMAVNGIIQGVCVGVWLGSWPVMIYSLGGAVAWHFIARPPEEADLTARFGDVYLDYQSRVRCWIPARQAYPIMLPSSEREIEPERTVH